jgi:hypothetical protein
MELHKYRYFLLIPSTKIIHAEVVASGLESGGLPGYPESEINVMKS